MATETDKIASIIHDISFHPDDRVDLFLDLTPVEQTTILMQLSAHIKADLLTHLPEEEVVSVLSRLDPDDATDVLQVLSKHRQKKLLEMMSEDMKETVTTLLQFDSETAAGLMNVDYIQVSPNDDIASVAKKFKLHERRTGRLPVILVVDKGHLQGFLPGHQLGFGKASEKIKKYVRRVPTVQHSATHKEVSSLFKSHPHSKVVVLDDDRRVVGIIFSDDVLRLVQEQESASLYDFAGVKAEESVADGVRRKVRSRYRWLIINMGTAFLAAFTVGLFESTISKYVLLAVYMPIVAGMGGNAATQTLAVVVRGIALRQIDLHTAYRTLKNEVGAGFFNGLINGAIVATVVILKDHDYKIAFVLATAMVINLLVAAAFGTMVPLIMTKLKKDPATSATIFITTATDVLGFLAFLGIAQAILR